MAPSPSTYHQSIAGRVYSMLLRFLEEHPLGEAFIAPLDVFLTETDVYQPDVVFVSAQRRAIITEQGLEGAPDLVVEVLSPETARFDKGTKRKAYAQSGVDELWLIDPGLRLIQVYSLAQDSEMPVATYDERAVFESPLLLGLKIVAASIFKSPLGKLQR